MVDKPPKVFAPPVDWDELYPGRFIKASEFKGKQVTLRIATVHIEELIGDKGPQIKGIIAFERTEKVWAINRTNGVCVKMMFGSKVQDWVGKRVTLFPALHDGEPCIRVWGSPDIEKDQEVLVTLPRKRPFMMTMHKTGPKAGATNGAAKPAAAAAAAPPAEREPGGDDELTLATDAPYDEAASRALDLKLADD